MTCKKSFCQRVFNACKSIPHGRVTTYAAIAKAVNRPRAWRAVGNCLNKSPGLPTVPCHRVVRSDGSVGGFAFGTRKKIELLKQEGVEVNGRIVNLRKFFAKPFTSGS